MSNAYWQERRQDILSLRDYACTFDLAYDRARGASLLESGRQLQLIGWQLLFIDMPAESLDLAQRADLYFAAALDIAPPDATAHQAECWHGLYYARWQHTSQEPAELIRRAAEAYSAGLVGGKAEDMDVYEQAARLWLEAGAPEQAWPWQAEIERLGSETAGSGLADQGWLPLTLRALQGEAPREEACAGLSQAVARASAWDSKRAGTVWHVLQLANIRRCYCGPESDLTTLLERLR
jgi:hypothetical protein